MTELRFTPVDLRPVIEALDRTIEEYDAAIAAGNTVTGILILGRGSLRTMRETLVALSQEKPPC